jgi:LPXTG-motif cell wall-anchored protein
MMRKVKIRYRITILFLALLFCIPTAYAYPSDATEVIIDGATLTASNPYWKNGGGGDASDWNLFFDTSTSAPTLRMKNAVLNSLNPNRYIVQADGDIIVELIGDNDLSYSGSAGGTSIVGLGSMGSILIKDGTGNGTGALTINIDHSPSHFSSVGIFNIGNELVIDSGNLDISVYDSGEAFALYSGQDILIRGGSTQAFSWANLAYTVFCEQFRLTGGSIMATANGGSFISNGLFVGSALFSGGYGEFSSVESGNGAEWVVGAESAFRFSGGHVIFSGGNSALSFLTGSELDPDVAGTVYVSEFPSGMDKMLWNSSMDSLASYSSYFSPYRFVEMIGTASLPRTGDVMNPWLWLGIGTLALALGAGALLILRRKRA